MQPGLRDLLERRRNRAIAVILGVKERDCDTHLSAMASQKLRKVVLDQLNDYCELACDVLTSVGDANGVALNDHYLAIIEELHNDMLKRQRNGHEQ